MTLQDVWRLTRANLVLLFATLSLGVLGGYLYCLTQPISYSASATGVVLAGNPQSAGEEISSDQLAQTKANTYAALVNARPTAERIIRTLGLDESATTVAGQLSAYVGTNANTLTVNASGPTPEVALRLADAAISATAAQAKAVQGEGLPVGATAQSLTRIVPLESALLPGAPSTPNVHRLVELGALLGLLLGYLIALSRRTLDRRIRQVSDVEELAEAPVLGVIPRSSSLNGKGESLEPTGAAAESLRSLRTNLQFLNVDNPPRSILMTSAAQGEGKSSVTTRLAVLMALAGEKTVLIDADLRRPRVSTMFGVDGTVGLTQLLAGKVALKDVLQESGHPGLQILPAGRIPPNPSELLASQRMQGIIQTLARDSLVLIDAPPLLPVTDAGLLAARTDGAIVLFQVGRTSKEQIAQCVKVLDRVGARPLGVVLNRAPQHKMGEVVYGYGYGGNRPRDYYAEPAGDSRFAKLRAAVAARGHGDLAARRWWLLPLLGLLLVADLFVGYQVQHGVVGQPQAAPAITRDAQTSGQPVSSADVTGPVELVVSPGHVIVRATQGSCGSGAKALVDVSRNGGRLRRTTPASAVEVQWLGLRAGQPVLIGSDAACHQVVLALTSKDTWVPTSVPPGVVHVDTNGFTGRLIGPRGPIPVPEKCQTDRVAQSAGSVRLLCADGGLWTLPLQGAQGQWSLTDARADLVDFTAAVGGLGLFSEARCGAQLSRATVGSTDWVPTHCFGNDRAPLGVATDGPWTVVQVGHDLELSRGGYDRWKPVPAVA